MIVQNSRVYLDRFMLNVIREEVCRDSWKCCDVKTWFEMDVLPHERGILVNKIKSCYLFTEQFRLTDYYF